MGFLRRAFESVSQSAQRRSQAYLNKKDVQGQQKQWQKKEDQHFNERVSDIKLRAYQEERLRQAKIQGREQAIHPKPSGAMRALSGLGSGLEGMSKVAGKIDIGQAWSMPTPNYKVWDMGFGMPRANRPKRHHKKGKR